ncbi:MAG: hypothetical protein GY730_09965 [bacterium]|nr:hypothetical protein [bacterium]
MKTIKYIEPVSLAKISAAIVFCISLILLIPFIFDFARKMLMDGDFIFGSLAFMLLPFVYSGFAYILGILIAKLYNFFASKTGGIMVDLV